MTIRTQATSVHVVNSDVIPVLGLPSCIEVNLIQRVHNIESSTDTEENAEGLSKEYENLFDGIGTLPGEYKIEIDDHASPTIHPPRRIPHMLKDKVEDELKHMEKMGVITKVEQLTKWVNPMVMFEFVWIQWFKGNIIH